MELYCYYTGTYDVYTHLCNQNELILLSRRRYLSLHVTLVCVPMSMNNTIKTITTINRKLNERVKPRVNLLLNISDINIYMVLSIDGIDEIGIVVVVNVDNDADTTSQ